MDMHQIVSDQIQLNPEQPPLSADQVIEEIDEMMQVNYKSLIIAENLI